MLPGFHSQNHDNGDNRHQPGAMLLEHSNVLLCICIGKVSTDRWVDVGDVQFKAVLARQHGEEGDTTNGYLSVLGRKEPGNVVSPAP